MFITAHHTRLHVVSHPGKGRPVLFAHGLTANAHAFDGLVAAGLGDFCQPVSVDLRGRGLSDAPADGYTMQETAKDMIAVLDALGLDNVVMAGHSYGAFLSWYLAAYYPARIQAVIAMDAAMRMHPRTLEMLGPSLGRLGKTWPSFSAYLQEVKQAPYLSFWDEQMETYYRADVREAEGGGVTPIPDAGHMMEAAKNVLSEPWHEILPGVIQPVLMMHAPDNYTLGEPLLPEAFAKETAALFPEINFVKVKGNHQTMLYGEGAKDCVEHIGHFLQRLP